MSRIVVASLTAALAGTAAWAIVDPNFTPKHLCTQAEVIAAGKVRPTGDTSKWKLAVNKQIKGRGVKEMLLDLSRCKPRHLAGIRKVLTDHVKDPAMAFTGTLRGERRGYLHIDGVWLALRQGKDGKWMVPGYDPPMTGTFAGGTDQLVRMSEYIVNDPDSDVPVYANVRWQGDPAEIGALKGECSGMAVVAVGKSGQLHLFVGSGEGDRLFKCGSADGKTTFTEITKGAALDTASRQFAWMDVNGDGLADLVSFDGKAVSVRLAGADGKFSGGGNAWTAAEGNCTALVPCSLNGKPGVLVSTDRAPVLLVGDGSGWGKRALPAAKGDWMTEGQMSACIVADFDNDGYADVIQPGEQGGLMWKGSGKGFASPVKSAVSTDGGKGKAAVADFNQDGLLDIFIAGADRNGLWENDGGGNFRNVFRYAGSLSYKCPAGAADVAAMDLNHDGRMDIALVYDRSDFQYHHSRGFRCFIESGEVTLPGLEPEPGAPRLGQKAIAAGDLNGDGSRDLVVLVTDGRLVYFANDQNAKPAVRLRLPRGVTGPVTASCWIGDRYKSCVGTAAVAGHAPPGHLCTRRPGKVTVKWHLPGRGEQSKTVEVKDRPADVILGAEGKK